MQNEVVITDEDIFNLFHLISNEVFKLKAYKNQPKKINFKISGDDNIEMTYINCMSAKTRFGVGNKVIYIDDTSKKMSASTLYMRNDGGKIVFNSEELTCIRCAIMALLSFEKFMQLSSSMMIGLIGDGKINTAVKKVARIVYGINNFNICKKKEDVKKIDACDLISVATNNAIEKNLYSIDLFSKNKVFVVQDCGYTLDSTFREHAPAYSDSPYELKQKFLSEFPFDKKRFPVKSIFSGAVEKTEIDVVYLYGIAITDVLCAEYFYEKTNRKY